MTNTLSPEQLEAYDAILRGENVFLTGPGGTGKSYLLALLNADIPEKTGRTVAITALTGCAALLIGNRAKTIHSWAGIGLGKGSADYHATNIRKIAPLAMRWRKTEVLVVDEVSMLTPDLLELLEEVARIVRRNERPFGGLQLVFVGDFLQLPPVAKGAEIRFAFESPLWSQLVQRTVKLKRIFRQKDAGFQTILDGARMGELSEEGLALLKSRMDLPYDKELIQPTMLFTRKADVEGINKSNLDSLPGQVYTFAARTLPSGHPSTEITRTVERMDKDAAYVANLLLKKGAQVMLLKNLDTEKGLVNGSRGVVIDFKEDGSHLPIVEFRNGQRLTIDPATWQSEHDPPIVREQIPLRLAYALTIHKAQGATLDCALIDIGPSTFEYGQAYVALSRVKNLESLYVFDVSKSAFRAHPVVKDFYKAPPAYAPKAAVQETVIPARSTKRTTPPSRTTPPKPKPLSGKKATYGFAEEDEEAAAPAQQQASLTKFWGVPKKTA